MDLKMIWRVRKPYTRHRAKKQWHWWFAWHPVRVPTKGRMSKMHKVWLCKVRRKGVYRNDWGESYWEWYYAIPGQEYDLKKPRPIGPPPKGGNGVTKK